MKIFKNFEIRKILHGKTENNEGVNFLIWKHCPKTNNVGLTVTEIGAASAVINFDDDIVGIIRTLAKLGIIPGSNSIEYYNEREKARIYQIIRKQWT